MNFFPSPQAGLFLAASAAKNKTLPLAAAYNLFFAAEAAKNKRIAIFAPAREK